MTLFKPPPPPPVPIPSHYISIAEDKKFALHVAKHFRLALDNLAHLMMEASGEREPSLSHHYISGTLSVFNDPKYEPLWPIFYPTTHFETNLLRQIHAIQTDLKEITATTTPPTPPPQPPTIDTALFVAALNDRFNDLKKETAVTLKSFADAVKASAPTPSLPATPPQKPKPM